MAEKKQVGYGVPTKDPTAYRTTPIDPVQGELPNPETVRRFHMRDDVDGNPGSHHHTLGPRPGQASPGDHDHRGGSSKKLLEGVSITGATTADQIASIIEALEELGATDSTT